ncbi:hypothetical protein MDA_GLEAN10015869 [Myotis davidii]|uniref:Uncharacterized protein n=1 Tax=Myotis davidii TaxID=225400 RepID=L5LL69_MYODS|nr:hypothetical protein MDA_GLEAN10015869 [Myotis davidii]
MRESNVAEIGGSRAVEKGGSKTAEMGGREAAEKGGSQVADKGGSEVAETRGSEVVEKGAKPSSVGFAPFSPSLWPQKALFLQESSCNGALTCTLRNNVAIIEAKQTPETCFQSAGPQSWSCNSVSIIGAKQNQIPAFSSRRLKLEPGLRAKAGSQFQ